MNRIVLTFVLVAAICTLTPSSLAAATAPLADHILVTKSSHTMVLLSQGKVLRTYQVALGRATGKKTHQGDHKTPEGAYVIDAKNAQSRFHLALHVSYPNAEDRQQASTANAAPGGDIMIHGLESPFAWIGKSHRLIDWTDGCIAVSNPEIEEIWKLVPVGTPVEIKP